MFYFICLWCCRGYNSDMEMGGGRGRGGMMRGRGRGGRGGGGRHNDSRFNSGNTSPDSLKTNAFPPLPLQQRSRYSHTLSAA